MQPSKSWKSIGDGLFASCYKINSLDIAVKFFEDIDGVGNKEVKLATKAGKLGLAPKCYGFDKKRQVIFFDFIDGIRLETRTMNEGPLSLGELISILEMRKTLQLNKIAHNDLHDENILWSPSAKRFYFVDFGQATENKTHIYDELTDSEDNFYLYVLNNSEKKHCPKQYKLAELCRYMRKFAKTMISSKAFSFEDTIEDYYNQFIYLLNKELGETNAEH